MTRKGALTHSRDLRVLGLLFQAHLVRLPHLNDAQLVDPPVVQVFGERLWMLDPVQVLVVLLLLGDPSVVGLGPRSPGSSLLLLA